jgi:hypothetical protein
MTTGRPFSSTHAQLERGLFTLALLLSTWIPMAFFIAVGSVGKPAGGLDTIKTALMFIGGVHVAATLLLYVDKKFLGLVRENKPRYVYVPVALIVSSGLIFTFGGAVVQTYAYLIFWAWQTHHYGRQNIGVYSFASIARGWPPHRLERRVLDLAAACAMCGTFNILARDVAPGYLHAIFELLYRIGAIAFLGVLIFSVYVYVKHRHDFSLSRTAFFFTLVLFFFPMFLSDNIDVAFFSYAIAHGTQYLAFMTVLSVDLGAREGRQGVSKRMIAVAVFMVLLGLVGYRATDLKAFSLVNASPILTTVIDFMAGIGLGTTIAHFVIDAGAWKLSRPSARHYVTQRFGFLFERAVRGHGAVSQAFSR